MLKEKSLTLLLCCLATAGPLGALFYLPALPGMSLYFTAHRPISQMSLSVYLFSTGISALIYGLFACRYDKKLLIIISGAIFTLGSLYSASAPNITTLLFARTIEGIGAGGMTSLALAIIYKKYKYKRLKTILFYLTIAVSLTSMISPLLGATLLQSLDWRAIFVALSVYTLALVLIVFVFMGGQTKYRQDTLPKIVSNYKELFTNRHFMHYSLLGGIAFSGLFAYYIVSPYLFQIFLNYTPTHYSYFFFITSSGFLLGGATNKWLPISEFRRLASALFILLLSSVILVLLAMLSYPTALVILAPITLYFYAVGIIFPCCLHIATEPFNKSIANATTAMYSIQLVLCGITTMIVARLPQYNQISFSIFLVILSVIIVLMRLLRDPDITPWQ